MNSDLSILSRLKRASHRNHSFGKAPHKPILILAILEAIETGLISDNKITITPELIAIFQNIWLKLVPHEGWQPRFYLPFFHLTGDKFWNLETADGAKVALTSSYSPKSVLALQKGIEYAYLTDHFWRAFANSRERKKIHTFLLDHYFPGQSYDGNIIRTETSLYLEQLEMEFEQDKAAEPVPTFLKTVSAEARSAVFQNRVPKIYNYTCAISGLRVTAVSGVQMIDACHITPWSSSKNDTIQNGIALTPTLHRAFDRKLIHISTDYRVVVSGDFVESKTSPFNLRQFHGRRILLPERESWWPDRNALADRIKPQRN